MGRPQSVTFNPGYYVRVYELSRAGTPREGMAQILGVPESSFRRWYRENPYLREAINAGRRLPQATNNVSGPTFAEYVATRLPDELIPLWNELNDIFQVPYDASKDTASAIETLFAGRSERMRQMIFIHSLPAVNFSKSEAMRRINVNHRTFKRWLKQADFRELFNEIMGDVKKDFFESLLIRAANAGDTGAIIFGNKALNADRGYGNKLQIEHSGTVGHLHESVDTDDLSDMPVEIQRRAIALAEDIAAYRRDGKLPPKTVQALPAHNEEEAA